MTEAIKAVRKQEILAWDKQCRKLFYRYLVLSIPVLPLCAALGGAFVWFLQLVTPLVKGDLVYGEVGYEEYQEGKDVVLIILAVLLVLNVTLMGFLHAWYKKRIRALGPRPGGMPGKWKRWLFSL